MQKLVFVNGAGKEIDLTSGNFGIVNWEGLSNTDLNIQSQQVPFEDGGVFLDALIEQREIELTVAIYDGNDLELRYQKKRELISVLNPKLGEGILTYTNNYLSKQIKAVPQIPLFENKNSNDAGTLKAEVAFTCCNPYWEDLTDTEITVANATNNEGLYIANLEVDYDGDVETGFELQIGSGLKDFKITKTSEDEVKQIQIKRSGYVLPQMTVNTNVGQKDIKGLSIIENQSNLVIDEAGAELCITYQSKAFTFRNGLYYGVGNYTNQNEKDVIIFTSSDLIHWNKKSVIANDIWDDKMRFIFFDEESDILYLGFSYGADSKIYKSTDDGETWEFVETVTGKHNDMCFNKKDKTVFVSQGVCAYNELTQEVCEAYDGKMYIHRNNEIIIVEKEGISDPQYMVSDKRGNYYLCKLAFYGYAYFRATDYNGNEVPIESDENFYSQCCLIIDNRIIALSIIPYTSKMKFFEFVYSDGKLHIVSEQEVYSQFFCHYLNNTVFGFSDNETLYSDRKEKFNLISSLIQYLQDGSDMGMKLTKGKNTFVITYEKDVSDNIGIKMKFRQKYIGV